DLVHAAAEVGILLLDVIAVARDEVGVCDVRMEDFDLEAEMRRELVAIAQRLGKDEPGIDEDDRQVHRDLAPEMEEHAALSAKRRREEQAFADPPHRECEALLGGCALEPLVLPREVERLFRVGAHAAHSPAPVCTRKPAFSPMSVVSSVRGAAVTMS